MFRHIRLGVDDKVGMPEFNGPVVVEISVKP